MRILLILSLLFLCAFSPPVVTSPVSSSAGSAVPGELVVVEESAVLISGLEIYYSHTNWFGALAVAVQTADGTNVIPSTLVTGGASNDFSSITAGEYTSDTFSATYASRTVHVWSKSTADANTHWLGNAANPTSSFYIEFSTPIELATVQIIMYRAEDLYGFPTITFQDQDGNALTPATSPANAADTNGDEIVDGVTAHSSIYNDRYKWTF